MNDAMAIYLHEGTPRGIDLLKSSFEKVFLVLACGDDGMVCLSYAELKQILDNQHNPIEWISATQHKREMYLVKGSNGELDFKIEQSDFSNKLFAALVLPPLRGLKIIWDFSPRLKPWAIIGRLVPRFQFALICEIRVKEPLRLRVSAVKKKAASVFHLRR